MTCELCGAEAYNFHHFIPKTLHSNKWFKKRYTKKQMSESGIDICKECHTMIHNMIPSEKDLGRNYNTLEKLKGHPKMAKYLEWRTGGLEC